MNPFPNMSYSCKAQECLCAQLVHAIMKPVNSFRNCSIARYQCGLHELCMLLYYLTCHQTDTNTSHQTATRPIPPPDQYKNFSAVFCHIAPFINFLADLLCFSEAVSHLEPCISTSLKHSIYTWACLITSEHFSTL